LTASLQEPRLSATGASSEEPNSSGGWGVGTLGAVSINRRTNGAWAMWA